MVAAPKIMKRGQFEVRPGLHPRGFIGVFGQYCRAIDYLYEAISKQEHSADHCSYPILYLVRHALEVGYKANIACLAEASSQAIKHQGEHRLGLLHVEFVRLVESAGTMDDETLSFFRRESESMMRLADMMPSTSSFRYDVDPNGNKVFNFEVIDLLEVKSIFERAKTILSITSTVVLGEDTVPRCRESAIRDTRSSEG